MTSEAASNDISSLYPPAPPYIKFFTNENVEKVKEYKKNKTVTNNEEEDGVKDENNNGEGTKTNDDIITCELDFLIPPPMPSNQQYRAFGSVWQVKDQLPDLEVMGITQLYKKSEDEEANNYQNKIQELRKLLKSLLLNYLELVGIISINPELFEQKVENIRTILVNIHHLLNEYRPHQSRESLIMLLEEQLEYKKSEIKKIEEVCSKVQEKLENIQKTLT